MNYTTLHYSLNSDNYRRHHKYETRLLSLLSDAYPNNNSLSPNISKKDFSENENLLKVSYRYYSTSYYPDNSFCSFLQNYYQENTYTQETFPKTTNFKYRYPHSVLLNIESNSPNPELSRSIFSENPINFVYNFDNPDIKRIGEVDGCPVYSKYPKYLYDKFDDFYKIDSLTSRNFHFDSFALTSTNTNYVYSSSFRGMNQSTYNNSYAFPAFADALENIFNCFFSIRSNYFFSLENDFCNSDDKKKVIKSNNITSFSKRTSFEIKEVTSKAFRTKTLGMLIPCLLKVPTLDFDNNPNESYIFTFLIPYYDKILSNKSSAEFTFDYLKDLFHSTNIYKHFEYDLYLQKLQEETNIAIGDLKSLAYLELLKNSNLSPSDLLDFNLPTLKDPLDRKTINSLTSKLNVDSSRLTSISNKYMSIATSLTNQIHFSFEALKKRRSFFRSALDVSKNSHIYFIENQNKFTNFNFKKLSKIANLYNKENDLYLQKEALALENNDFISDSYFENIESQNIQIISMEKDSLGGFRSLEFLVTEPFKIIIDGVDNDRAIVAGPLKVHLQTNSSPSLSLSAYNKQVYYGYTNSSFKLHPHSSSSNSASQLFSGRQHSCCLGEASPMIYKAVEACDFKMIIVSIMIWLKSANSADAWGRSYTSFIKWKDYENAILTQEQVQALPEPYTSEDVSFSLNEYAETVQADPVVNLSNTTEPEPEIPQVQIPQNPTYNRYTQNV